VHLIGHEHEGGGEVDDVVSATAVEHVVIEALVLEKHALGDTVPVELSKLHAEGHGGHNDKKNIRVTAHFLQFSSAPLM
jgi:hypothetical protein